MAAASAGLSRAEADEDERLARAANEALEVRSSAIAVTTDCPRLRTGQDSIPDIERRRTSPGQSRWTGPGGSSRSGREGLVERSRRALGDVRPPTTS